MADMRKNVANKAITHLDENHDFYCTRSMLHFKVMMICGMATSTAAYDIYNIFLLVRQNSVRILLCITFFGAMISQLTIIPMADRWGRKFMLEVSLFIIFVSSILSVISFYSLQQNASGPNVVGSLIFWRFFLGIGCGGIYPLTATIMAEYSSKFSRGTYLSLVYASQGSGIVIACLITLIASSSIGFLFPSSYFPTEVIGCSSFAWIDSNMIIPCPPSLQKAYYTQVMGSSPPENNFIWRSVVATGSFGALVTLLFSYIFLVETPRFTSHVLRDNCEIDYVRDVRTALLIDSEHADAPMTDKELFLVEFLTRYSAPLFLASSTWFIFNLVFSGQLIIIDEPAKVIGFNKGNIWQPASDECFGLALGYLTVCLIALIPGYYVCVVTIDAMGRKIMQFLGFVWMAIWCSASSGSYAYLTNPNMPADDVSHMNKNGTKSRWMIAASGWMVMFALTFFFASWGPLTTTYVIPSELFPTKWRVTGYSICAAAGSFSSFIGVWIFTYTSQPYPKQIIYSYPCLRSEYPSDLNSQNACVENNYCPPGRSSDGSPATNCDNCQSNAASGCYPFGLGLVGSMGIMVPILAFGAVMTMMFPLTDRKSVDELCVNTTEVLERASTKDTKDINIEMMMKEYADKDRGDNVSSNIDDDSLVEKARRSHSPPAEIHHCP